MLVGPKKRVLGYKILMGSGVWTIIEWRFIVLFVWYHRGQIYQGWHKKTQPEKPNPKKKHKKPNVKNSAYSGFFGFFGLFRN